MLNQAISEDRSPIILATKIFEYLLKVGFSLIPSLGIWYLQTYQSPTLREVAHHFHNLAILAAILASCFVAYVTWKCYRFSGEPFLRWLTLGFIGFTIIYAPHGLFTTISDLHMALFLLYGPASRLVMMLLLFVGLLRYGRNEDTQADRDNSARWWRWILHFSLRSILPLR